MRFVSYLIIAVLFTGLGLWLGRSDAGRGLTQAVHHAGIELPQIAGGSSSGECK